MSIIPNFGAPAIGDIVPAGSTKTDGGWRAVPAANEIRWTLAPLPAADTLSITDTYRHLALAAVQSLYDLHRDHKQLQAANVRLLAEFRAARALRSKAA